MKGLLSLLLTTLAFEAMCQFPPPDGQPGTTAMHQDSSAFVAWAQEAIINRGFQNISDTSLGYTSIGDSTSCLGKADNLVVSLGDGGEAIIVLDNGIYDGPGWDFAVFENSFVNNFLELAFVEVSSDGQNYYRFPAASLTPDTLQIGPFDFIDATKINNLAGKYRGTFGTPFDLSELSHHPGLDLNHISHIKIIDVVGSLDPNYASKDTADHFINDPWPTPFPSSGFDLDAVGIINAKPIGIDLYQKEFSLYPNPASDFLIVEAANWTNTNLRIEIRDLRGQLVWENLSVPKDRINIPLKTLAKGQYIIQLQSRDRRATQMFFIN